MNLKLEGKVALVTGSYRGTGAGIAERLCEEGAHVIVHGFKTGQTKSIYDRLNNRNGRVSCLEFDPLKSTKEEIQSILPAIDILINNYGKPVESSWESIESWAEEWEHNVLMGVKFSQSVIRHMMANGWGRILFLGTIGIDNPGTHSPGYYGAKAALVPIVKSLAYKLKHSGVTANLLNPGMIATDEVKEMLTKRSRNKGIGNNWNEIEEWATSDFMPNLTGRLSTPESIGDIVAFMVSDFAYQINGAIIPIDGGAKYT